MTHWPQLLVLIILTLQLAAGLQQSREKFAVEADEGTGMCLCTVLWYVAMLGLLYLGGFWSGL